MFNRNYLALDFGSTGSRCIAGSFNGSRLSMNEVTRMLTPVVTMGEQVYVDVLSCYDFVIRSVRTARRNRMEPDSLGCNSWGSDFGLIDQNGILIANPFFGRINLAQDCFPDLLSEITPNDLYRRGGTQIRPSRGLGYLYAIARKYPQLLDRADTLLILADLFQYYLTGVKATERSAASDTLMYHQKRRTWDNELLGQLKLPAQILPAIIDPGEVVGDTLPSVSEQIGGKVKVTAVCEHDTASAFFAVPSLLDKSSVFLFCGTSCLLCCYQEQPRLEFSLCQAQYSNNAFYQGDMLLKRTIVGLWLYQRVCQGFGDDGKVPDYDNLAAEIERAPALVSFIDPDDPRFMSENRTDLLIQKVCEQNGQAVPRTRGEILRCILESLALKYRIAIIDLERILHLRYKHIYVSGGGSQDCLLMQSIANAMGRVVLTGPVEATAVGNIGIQLIAAGEVGSAREFQQLVRESFAAGSYEPQAGQREAWLAAVGRYEDLYSSPQNKFPSKYGF